MLPRIAAAGLMVLLASQEPLLAQEEAQRAQPASLRVEVVAGETQQAVADAEVKIHLESTEIEFSRTGWTKEDGAAVFSEVPRGKIRLQVIHKDWQTHGEFFVLNQAQQTARVILKKD
ncbi:MAG: hypothetical protein HY822_17880 [Acidobacteria bacterium]|nr:hypothetical protein [Acidobacteriota bacterium]